MIRVECVTVRGLAALVLGLLLVACGGGGIDVLPDDPEGIAQVSGTVVFSEGGGEGLPVLEAEPNDSPDTAHRLGSLKPGERIEVHGHVSAVNDADPFDGFHLVVPERARVTATLAFPAAGGNDFDLAVFDLLSFQLVEVFFATTAPEVGVFHAKGSFDLIVNAYAGEGDYVLTIQTDPAPNPIPERESNDLSGEAQYLGEVLIGDTVSVAGELGPLDTVEGLLVGCPQGVDLDVSLAFLQGRDYDLLVYDATSDLYSPTLLAALQSASSNPEVGTVTIPAGSLVFLEVATFGGTGPWSLTITGTPSTALAQKSRGELGGRLAPWTAESRRRKGGRADLAYGRPRLEVVPGEVLIGYEEDAGGAHAAKSALAPGILGARSIAGGAGARLAFAVPADLDLEEARRYTLSRVAAYASLPGVRYAEPNYVCRAHAEPDDTYWNLQWHFELIHLPEAWEVTTGSATIIAAVLDTGRTDHPDLVGRQVGGYDFISDPTSAGDGGGRDADPTDVGDLQDFDGTSSFHGTHVAGTIGAATNNGRGVAGATWATQIMHLRVLGRQGGTIDDIAAAIRYAARLPNASGQLPPQRAHLVNMSLGGAGYTQTMQDAIDAARAAGVVIFASAGNESTSAATYPAAHDGVISVVAVDLDGDLAPYSNFGPTVDLAAPGGDTSVDRNGDSYVDGVLSTMYDDGESPPKAIYRFYQGTSMACPHAVGVAALVLAVDPTLTPDEVESILTSTAEDLGTPGRDNLYGHGLVNAHAAVLAAQGGATGSPVLFLSPEALSFSNDLTILDSTITNGAAGFLEVTDLTPFTQAGGSWLSASLGGAGDSSRNADTVRVAVSRSGLPFGSYSGRIVVDSTGGPGEIQVLMSVGPVAPPPPDVSIYVLALDADTYETVAEVVVNPSSNLDFLFAALPPGDYVVAAGTDLDDDGFICDDGEYCGWYPVAGEPVTLRLAGGDRRTGLSFVVEPDELVPASAERRPACGLRRLRR